MSFMQIIPFDTTKGGSVPNLCLDNVRRGYGISNKYNSAWEAWQHTQQHPDRNVPAGLDVPLYYSYTTTLDGVTQNYGHINVRLKNGTVWSDGKLYASIDAYTANHFPKFVGWGESVNDFKVIQGSEAPMSTVNDGDTTNYFWALFDRAPDQAELDKNRNKEWNNPDPNLRAPLYSDMLGRGHYLTEENKKLQKLVNDSTAQYEQVTETLYRKKG